MASAGSLLLDEGQRAFLLVNVEEHDAVVTADADGNVADSFSLPEWFVAEYLTVDGSEQGRAALTALMLIAQMTGLTRLDLPLVLGTVLGLVAGYRGGRVDSVIMRLVDLQLAIPSILIALVLYVNEVPDRPADAAAGKRTLPVRFSKEAIVNLYAAAVCVTFASIVVFALAGWIVRPALIALVAAPLDAAACGQQDARLSRQPLPWDGRRRRIGEPRHQSRD